MADETEPQDLSHLSPTSVLGGQIPAFPDAPAHPEPSLKGVPLPITTLSRDELLKQAAEAPDTELILPPTEHSTETPVLLRQSPPKPFSPSPLAQAPLPQAPSSSLPEPPKPAAVLPEPPKPAAVLPEPPKPIAAMPEPPMPPKPEAVPEHIAKLGADIETIRAHRKHASAGDIGKIFAAVGGSLVLVSLIAGILYVLVLRGARIPLLYPAISHLAGDGLSERDRALKALSAANSFRYAPNSQISLKLTSGAATSLGSTDISPVSSVMTTLQSAQAILPAEQLTAKANLNGNGSVQVPLLYASGDLNWSVQLPLNADQSTRQVLATEMHSSFLPVVIQPIRLKAILSSATAVTAYRQETRGGQRAAVYTYSLDPKLLATSLPSEVVPSNPSATVAYAWNSDRPLSSDLSTVLTQGKAVYSYVSSLTYQDWNSTASDTSLNRFTASTGSNLPVSDLIAQLGFAAGSLPGSEVVNTPQSTATPHPTFSPTPSTTPQPITALVPAGQSTAQLLPTITATPPPPSATASPQMLSDDIQRKNDLQLLQSALERYKTENKSYPKSNGLEQVQASQTLLTSLLPKYMTALPIDPSRTVFWYEYLSDGSTFSLRSVAQNSADPAAKQGVSYHYFEYFNAKS